ncbi:TPA: acyl carrier protein, partial [Streptococcus equi subsp. equi]|nr:acyl carrier protein [Streptococcus equi subsp. equi]
VNEEDLDIKDNIYKSNDKNIHNKNIEKICDVAGKILGKNAISPDTDLYNCGADSLLLAQLSREIVDILNKSETVKELKFDEVYREMLKNPTIESIVSIVEYEDVYNKNDESKSENINNDYKINLFNEGHDLLKVVLFDSFGTSNNIKNILDGLVEKNDSTIATFSIINEASYCGIEDENLLAYISALYAGFIEKSNYSKIQLIGFQAGGILAVEIATKLLKKGKNIDKAILIDSCPIEAGYLKDEIIEEEFLKLLGIEEKI